MTSRFASPAPDHAIERPASSSARALEDSLQQWPTDASPDWAGIDIFRLNEEAKIVEHWDVLQVVPAMSASSNGMF